jgi:15-cis-phytoene synthase
MKIIFDELSEKFSALTTQRYSTSFSLGITLLGKKFHQPIYNLYGFVRLADEIVDSFHEYNKKELIEKFRMDTMGAIKNKISLNPILNSFQKTVNEYHIPWELIDGFLKSMELDLEEKIYDEKSYKQYIYGSAEVVGLMCLKVFLENDHEYYNELKPFAMRLGSAFQKVNFLRDIHSDFSLLGRTYFPNINFIRFSNTDKKKIEQDIQLDFNEALIGIRKLPISSRRGVYLAYYYYSKLFKKIKQTPCHKITSVRVRISNISKIVLMLKSLIRFKLNYL